MDFCVAARVAGAALRNPAVISPLLGILFAMTALSLPKAASNYLDLIAAAVVPGALFAWGCRSPTGNCGAMCAKSFGSAH